MRAPSGFQAQDVIAFTVFEVAQNCGAPRTLHEISRYTCVDSKRIYKISHLFCQVALFSCRPSELANRVCKAVGIYDYSTIQEIANLADEHHVLSAASPSTVLAAAIDTVVKAKKLTNITRLNIASYLGINVSSLVRVKKRMHKGERERERENK